jgi:hypothetical protein
MKPATLSLGHPSRLCDPSKSPSTPTLPTSFRTSECWPSCSCSNGQRLELSSPSFVQLGCTFAYRREGRGLGRCLRSRVRPRSLRPYWQLEKEAHVASRRPCSLNFFDVRGFINARLPPVACSDLTCSRVRLSAGSPSSKQVSEYVLPPSSASGLLSFPKLSIGSSFVRSASASAQPPLPFILGFEFAGRVSLGAKIPKGCMLQPGGNLSPFLPFDEAKG